jgi:hypothetical protein
LPQRTTEYGNAPVCAHQCIGKGVPQYFAARVVGRRFLEAVIKAKLANILSNQDESDVAFVQRAAI